MGKAELGLKLTCESCGARFYDLNKSPATCPKCGTSNSRPAVFKTRGRPAPEEREEKRAPVVEKPKPEEEEDAIPESEEDEEDEAVIEDTSDLGEDDDVEVVVENDREA